MERALQHRWSLTSIANSTASALLPSAREAGNRVLHPGGVFERRELVLTEDVALVDDPLLEPGTGEAEAGRSGVPCTSSL